jgi:hypothetical protein
MISLIVIFVFLILNELFVTHIKRFFTQFVKMIITSFVVRCLFFINIILGLVVQLVLQCFSFVFFFFFLIIIYSRLLYIYFYFILSNSVCKNTILSNYNVDP